MPFVMDITFRTQVLAWNLSVLVSAPIAAITGAMVFLDGSASYWTPFFLCAMHATLWALVVVARVCDRPPRVLPSSDADAADPDDQQRSVPVLEGVVVFNPGGDATVGLKARNY